ncbi:MAG: oxidoreductase, partial [Phycisphaerae bacterium]|nr:oxidoreductase [Phycisphaerae bacterium]
MGLSCSSSSRSAALPAGSVKIMTLDPGHFHAALVQKIPYPAVNPDVHVFAPPGSDVQDHLDRIKGFNSRAENPTNWNEIVYTGPDFLDKMLKDRPGNFVVMAGNNRLKTRYIKSCADAGLNQLCDKPMCIDTKGFDLLVAAFDSAKKNKVLLYDIMTERSEIATILQKELMQVESVFGRLQKGTPENPAVDTESVHHLYKEVAGVPLKRPGWYFDTDQQGEGIVDVTTHLVDLVQWQCFPEQIIDYKKDIRMIAASRWPTMITKDQYTRITRLDDFIPELKSRLDSNGVLPCYTNGEINYAIKGVHARVRVIWNYEAPAGTKDTHFAVMKGTRSSLTIRQGKEQNYRPELYIEPAADQIHPLAAALPKAVAKLQAKYPGITLERLSNNVWHIQVPDKYHVGHEAHFGEVTERYLQYLAAGKLPKWEVPNM